MTPTISDIGMMRVNDVVQQYPTTLRLFQAYGIDACCGGALSVPEAARRHGIDPLVLRTALLNWISSEKASGGTDADACQCGVVPGKS